jgi:hypothetical protein
MTPSLIAMLAVIAPIVDRHAGPHVGYRFDPQHLSKDASTIKGPAYRPQPGDIVMFDDHNAWTAKIYRSFGTGGPLHAGIVFQKPDGSTAILEAGTNAVRKVFVFDLEPRFKDFNGTILIRRLRKPLSAEQSKKLTEFTLAQEGKPYALGRLLLQMTPFRPRNAPLSQFLGGTVIHRDRWICSELVIASATVAGVWEHDTYPANAMYPRDLCYDERFDLSPYYETPWMWYPQPELEWLGKGVRVGNVK